VCEAFRRSHLVWSSRAEADAFCNRLEVRYDARAELMNGLTCMSSGAYFDSDDAFEWRDDSGRQHAGVERVEMESSSSVRRRVAANQVGAITLVGTSSFLCPFCRVNVVCCVASSWRTR
jgi:hypothetical protein